MLFQELGGSIDSELADSHLQGLMKDFSINSECNMPGFAFAFDIFMFMDSKSLLVKCYNQILLQLILAKLQSVLVIYILCWCCLILNVVCFTKLGPCATEVLLIEHHFQMNVNWFCL